MPKSGCLPPIPPPISSKSALLLPSVRYGRRFFALFALCSRQAYGGAAAPLRGAGPRPRWGARTAGLRPAAAPPPVLLRRGSIGKCSPPLRKSLCRFLPIYMNFSPFLFWQKSVLFSLFSPERRLWGGELRKHFSKERCSQTAMPFFAVFELYFGLFLSPVQNQMHR